ncbi:DMT family transporter [Nocardiopsis rhodophaea]|uniref:DMT family transporter n=1 Tax=Nocardiopsis rhodophaea TaxID=280238 RepID=A0ABN2S1S2_9ACTN
MEGAGAVGLVIMWSSGFIGAQLGTDTANTLTVLMWRFDLVTVGLLAWWLLFRRVRIPARQVLTQAGIGFLAQTVYLWSVFGAVELGVSSGTTSLIDALQPLFATALVATLLFERVTRRQWVGLTIGFAGVAIVISGDFQLSEGAPLWIYFIPFIGMISLSIATFLGKKARSDTNLLDCLLIQCSVSAVSFTILAAFADQLTVPQDIDFWKAIAFGIVFSTIGGYGLYWWNLRRTSVARVGSLIYLTPPTTALWASWWFGDPITTTTVVGMAICLGAVYLAREDVRTPLASKKPAARQSRPDQQSMPETEKSRT